MRGKVKWFVCGLVILLAAACAPTLAETEPIAVERPQQQPQWPEELMWVRPEGAAGQLVAYNMADGQHLFTLPPGQLAANQQHYVAAFLRSGVTEVSQFDPATGALKSSFALDGRWLLKGISPNGRWLALVADEEKQQAQGWQTKITVVATEDGRTVHTMELEGHFEVDALSNDGKGLFLIQYVPPDQPEKYAVRLYDLAHNSLLPEPLRDKRAGDEVMAGYAWSTVADGQGEWWHTLYMSTARNMAFIHALNLDPDSRFTLCINLPSGEGEFAALQQYALTLSPDGRTIYATNPALGVVAEVSMETYEVAQQVTFEAAATTDRAPSRVLSSDGSQLFFSNGRQIWRYDTAAKTVSAAYLADSDAPVQGLAVSQDGARLAVALAGRPLQLFDVASGAALAFSGGEVAERPVTP